MRIAADRDIGDAPPAPSTTLMISGDLLVVFKALTASFPRNAFVSDPQETVKG
ncbi:MAG: hypothetical protein ACXVIS_07520 [Halobacteriota archaeon]